MRDIKFKYDLTWPGVIMFYLGAYNTDKSKFRAIHPAVWIYAALEISIRTIFNSLLQLKFVLWEVYDELTWW